MEKNDELYKLPDDIEVCEMQLSDLNPAPYNPRKKLKPGDREFEKLKKSIETFGVVELIVVNADNDNTIVSGHQRFSVLEHLGKEKAKCLVVHLTEEKERELNIAMNKIGGGLGPP